MDRWRTSLLSLLLLAAVGFCTTVRAEELKDISHLASQGHVQALEKVKDHLKSHPGDAAGQFLKGVNLTEQNKSADVMTPYPENRDQCHDHLVQPQHFPLS